MMMTTVAVAPCSFIAPPRQTRLAARRGGSSFLGAPHVTQQRLAGRDHRHAGSGLPRRVAHRDGALTTCAGFLDFVFGGPDEKVRL